MTDRRKYEGVTAEDIIKACKDVDEYLDARYAGDHNASFKIESLSVLLAAFRGESSVDAYLRRRWKALRDNANSVTTVAHLRAGIDALLGAGALTADQAELWCFRIQTCPGHDDEGGRVWCAFCGNLPSEEKGT